MSRFKVATCTGYTITPDHVTGGRSEGLTASVLDTLNAHHEVKRFRSEDRLHVFPGRRRGIEGAKRAAQKYADMLNAKHA